MKNLMLSFVVACSLAVGTLHAQNNTPVGTHPVPQAIVDRIHQYTPLTDLQAKALYALLLERSEKFAAMVKDENMKQGELKAAKVRAEQLNNRTLEKMKEILSPAQLELHLQRRQETQLQKAAYKEEDFYISLQDIELDF